MSNTDIRTLKGEREELFLTDRVSIFVSVSQFFMAQTKGMAKETVKMLSMRNVLNENHRTLGGSIFITLLFNFFSKHYTRPKKFTKLSYQFYTEVHSVYSGYNLNSILGRGYSGHIANSILNQIYLAISFITRIVQIRCHKVTLKGREFDCCFQIEGKYFCPNYNGKMLELLVLFHCYITEW